MFKRHQSWVAAGILIAGVLSGCRSEEPETTAEIPEAIPRPVTVASLDSFVARTEQRVSASVAAWKQEQIGFPVAGRVQRIIEPGEEIQGRVRDSDGHPVRAGTPLATLDPERYQLAVNSAQAAVHIAERQLEAAQVDVDTRLPARLRSLAAQHRQAQNDFDRSSRLVSGNAISRSELERHQTALITAAASEAVTKAELQARNTEIRSLQAQVEQAGTALAEAQVNLRDTRLFSSFNGQVVDVHCVPGSYVSVGDPVLTVQMMDPIKVEFEVSADQSRNYHYGDIVPVSFDVDGQSVELPGFVSLTDPVADAATRTFTVTLLVRNQRQGMDCPPECGDSPARTRELWPARMDALMGDQAGLMIESRAIQQGPDGPFLWRVKNRQLTSLDPVSRVLDVEAVPIQVGKQQIPFLNWTFVPFAWQSDIMFDVTQTLFTGAVQTDDGPAPNWQGQHLLLDDCEWVLRPGDIVQVQQSRPAADGIYVPVRCIASQAGQHSVFVVDDTQTPPCARRVSVTVLPGSMQDADEQTLRPVAPTSGQELSADMTLILEGAHFLVDGDPIVPVSAGSD